MAANVAPDTVLGPIAAYTNLLRRTVTEHLLEER
jgi:hypothetical protein